MLLPDKYGPYNGFGLPKADLEMLVNAVVVAHFLDPLVTNKEDNGNTNTRAYSHVKALPFTQNGTGVGNMAGTSYLVKIGIKLPEKFNLHLKNRGQGHTPCQVIGKQNLGYYNQINNRTLEEYQKNEDQRKIQGGDSNIPKKEQHRLKEQRACQQDGARQR